MKLAPSRSTFKLVENELDHYEVLLVDKNATGQEIHTSYRRLSRLLEPEVNSGMKSAEEHFQLVRRAYEVLINGESRKQYDLQSSKRVGKVRRASVFEEKTVSTLASWSRSSVWRPRLIAAALMAVGFGVASYFGDILFEPNNKASLSNPLETGSPAPVRKHAVAPVPVEKERAESLLASAEKILAFESPEIHSSNSSPHKAPDKITTENSKGEARGEAPVPLLESHPKIGKEPLLSSTPLSMEKHPEKSLPLSIPKEKTPEKDYKPKETTGRKDLLDQKSAGVPRTPESRAAAANSKGADRAAPVNQASGIAPASAEGGEQVKPAPPPESREKILAFLDRYTRAYENKNLDALTSFFEADAQENGEPLARQLPSYRESFKKTKKIKYDLEVVKWLSTDEGVEVSGKFSLETTESGRNKTTCHGPIEFLLTRHENDYRVRKLNYHAESSQEAKVEPHSTSSREVPVEPGTDAESIKKDTPSHREVQGFLNRYTKVYEQRNLKALEELFEGDALENGESFAGLRSIYQSNFQKTEKLKYAVKVLSLTPMGEGADVKGKFVLESVLDDKTHTESVGTLHLILTRQGGAYRIRSLDYHVESSREWTDNNS